jgi:hypothetical protein
MQRQDDKLSILSQPFSVNQKESFLSSLFRQASLYFPHPHVNVAHPVCSHWQALLPSTLIFPAWQWQSSLYLHSTALQSISLFGEASPVTLL